MSKYYSVELYAFTCSDSGGKRLLSQEFRCIESDLRKYSMEGNKPKLFFIKENNRLHRKKVIGIDKTNRNRDKLT